MFRQLIFISLITLFCFDFAFSWKADCHPVKRIRIIGSFGETKSGEFEVTSKYLGKQKVHAISDGEVIYKENRQANPLRPPLGRGDYVVMEHRENIRSYYLGLEENSIPTKLDKVPAGREIGESASQGAINTATVRLMIEDSRQKKILNPLSVLPLIEDKRSPKVQSVFVVINDTIYSFKNNTPRLRYRGEIKLYGIAKDYVAVLGDKGLRLWPKGVKRVSFYIDGKVWRDFDFDYLLIKKEGLRLFPNHHHDEIYGVPFNFKFGTFVPTKPKHTFELVCEDWVGNRDSKKYKVSFR